MLATRFGPFRMSYAGELGYEIHGDMTAIDEIYDGFWSAGEQHGIADYGSFAMNVYAYGKNVQRRGRADQRSYPA